MPIWDSAGKKLTRPAAINGGSKVKLAFQQVAWGDRLAEDGHQRRNQSPRHGTILKLRGIQLIEESESYCDQWREQEICNSFGVHPGGFIQEPPVIAKQVVSIRKSDIEGLNGPRRFERPKRLVS